MLLGMFTIINVTLVGALVSLAGNIPDSSFLVILSRYLRKKEESPRIILYPVESATRLEHARRKVVAACIIAVVAAGGLTVWALAGGWGTVSMLAVTLWVIAANIGFLQVPLGLWKRRVGRMQDSAMEEAVQRALSAAAADEAGGGGSDSGEEQERA
jgi:hypothetical protein